MKNRKKKIYLLFLVVSLSIFGSQIFTSGTESKTTAYQTSPFYYYYTEKVPLNVSTETIAVCFRETVDVATKETFVSKDEALENISDETLPYGLILVQTRGSPGKEGIIQAVERINKSPEVKYSMPVFEYKDLKLVATDEFAVRFKADMTEEDIQILNKQSQVKVVRKSPYRHNRYVLRVTNPKDRNAIEAANSYNENPLVMYSTPTFIVIGGYLNTEPDDTYFDQQWALDNWGQDPPAGTEDADMDAPEGWDISTGSSNTTIAIIDSGTDIDHEDLSEKIWVNEVELEGTEGVDDDGNGYIDDFYGWDFESDDNDPKGTFYHGTACAGLAAAETNNETGIAGVSWASKIMALKIGTSAPIVSAAAEAIDYAANNGANVLSNSWSGGSPNADLTDAIIDAKLNGRDGKGCVIVFASGNSHGPVNYPATLSETVAVGATDEDDVRWYYSNYGSELNVAAPSADGSVIFWTTDITGSGGANPGNTSYGDAAGNYYKWFSGTSAATPQVAGLAGLVISINADLTTDQVQAIIENTADDKGDSGWDQYYGWGRVNIYEAAYRTSLYSMFRIKNDSGDTIASFDNLGNIFLKGTLEENTTPTATSSDEFRIQDSNSADVAIIDANDCNMYIRGTLYELQEMLSGSASDDFTIKDANDDVVAYIDEGGDVYLKGRLFEEANP